MHRHSLSREALSCLGVAAQHTLRPLAHLNERAQGLLVAEGKLFAPHPNVVELDIVEEAGLLQPRMPFNVLSRFLNNETF